MNTSKARVKRNLAHRQSKMFPKRPEPEKAWMGTITGKKFNPFDPRVEDIDIRDIARGLAMTCRYGGQVKRFYSVAEHCVNVSFCVPPEYALHGLLHDSAEAYIGDMIRPIKHQPQMKEFRHAEALIEFAVAEKFGLDWDQQSHGAVKLIDDRILVDEIRELSYMPEAYLNTSFLSKLELTGRHLYCWSPEEAEQVFLNHFENLTGEHIERL